MKNKTKKFIMFLMSVGLLASQNVRISAASIAPGDPFSGSFYCGVYEGSIYATGSNATITSNVNWCDRGATVTAEARAGSSGTATISFIASDLVNTDAGTEVASGTIMDSTSVRVEANDGGGNNGNTGGNENTGGDNGSTGGNDGWNSDTDSQPDDDPIEKTPEEIAKEKEDKEKEEKEKAQKTPLVASIDIVSADQKQKGEVLKTLETKEDTWEYAYSLPKRIHKYSLDVKGVDEGVTLTYDENHEFKEGEAGSKTIEVRAVKGDITQTYKIKISLDTSKPVELSVGDKKATLMDDEVLDKYLADFGLKREVYKNKEGNEIPFYALGKTKLQLLVSEDKKAIWHILDESNAVSEPATVMFDKEKKPLLVDKAPETLRTEKLQGKSYISKVLIADETVKAIDPEINWDQEYMAWDFSAAEEVIYGRRVDEENQLYHLDSEKSVNRVIVSFDNEESQIYKYWAFGATAVSLVVTGMFVRFVFVKKKEHDVNL